MLQTYDSVTHRNTCILYMSVLQSVIGGVSKIKRVDEAIRSSSGGDWRNSREWRTVGIPQYAIHCSVL